MSDIHKFMHGKAASKTSESGWYFDEELWRQYVDFIQAKQTMRAYQFILVGYYMIFRSSSWCKGADLRIREIHCTSLNAMDFSSNGGTFWVPKGGVANNTNNLAATGFKEPPSEWDYGKSKIITPDFN